MWSIICILNQLQLVLGLWLGLWLELGLELRDRVSVNVINGDLNVFFWATICKTVHRMLSDHCPVCLSVLSVTLVYCGQMVEWMKMKVGMEVGLGPGHIVLDGDPAPPCQKKGHSSPQFFAHVLWPNGWMDQDATWYGGRS